MRTLFVLVAVVLLTGCNGIETKTERPTSATAAQSYAPAVGTPAGTPMKVVTFKGKASKNTTAFATIRPVKIDYTFSGRGSFVVNLYSTETNSLLALLVNTTGETRGETWTYGQNVKAYLGVTANGPWAIKVSTGEPRIAEVPASFNGTSIMVTTPLGIDGDVTVSYTHDGTGAFVVAVINADSGSGEQLVANTSGVIKDSTTLHHLLGRYAFDVTADGPWTLSITK